MEKIKITTYNTHLFLGSAFGFAPEYEDEERLEKLIWQLLKSPSDIVTLCEVWADSSKEKIITGLLSKFPYSYFSRAKKDSVKISSGLLILSKLKITESSFTQFNNLVGSDDWSQKGFIKTKLMDSSNTPIYVITTHTQSGNSSEEVHARWLNLQQIFDTIKTVGIDLNTPIFVTGDMNVNGEYKGGVATNEYSKVSNEFNELGFIDAYRTKNSQENISYGFTYNGYNNKLIPIFEPADNNVQGRLDFIFLNQATANINIGPIAVSTSYLYSDPKTQGLMDLSDHYPLSGEFN
jgi:exonuclease III